MDIPHKQFLFIKKKKNNSGTHSKAGKSQKDAFILACYFTPPFTRPSRLTQQHNRLSDCEILESIKREMLNVNQESSANNKLHH